MSVDERPLPVTVRPAPARPAGAWAQLRPLVLRVHFWAGVVVGPFLLVAALTGMVYTAMPVLEPLVYSDQLTVPAATTQLPLSDQVRIGMSALPGTELRAVRPGATPTDTTQVVADAADLPESYYRTAFVDPHTGSVRGVLDTYGSGQALPLRAWVDELHRNLHLGDVGRLYTELAASWLWVLVLGGLALWVGLFRRRRTARLTAAPGTTPAGTSTARTTRRGGRSLRALVAPRVVGPRRARLLSWHAVVGLWTAVGLLFLSATGLTWSTYAGAHVDELRAQLSWSTPSVDTSLSTGASPEAGETPAHGDHAGHAATVPTGPPSPASFDLAAAAAAREGLVGPVDITPGDAGEAWTVTQNQREWPQRLDAIAVDPASGAVRDVVRFADWPVAAKLARWGVDAHMGLLFGLPNQILLAALACGLACMVVWAYVLWWRRGPGRRAGHVPPGGVIRTLSPGLLTAVVLGTVAVGLALPVLGASLAVFLLLESLLDRNRTAEHPGVEGSGAEGPGVEGSGAEGPGVEGSGVEHPGGEGAGAEQRAPTAGR